MIDTSFEEAVASRDYVLLQDAIRDLSKKDAVEHLHGLFPHLTPSWLGRNLVHLQGMDPDGLASVLAYSDPTGSRAVRNVMKERASA